MAKDVSYINDYYDTDFRRHPKKYRIGCGENGVLTAKPYKSEILPHRRFKTPEIAKESAAKIYELYLDYKQQCDFVGMDMSRKLLEMRVTPAAMPVILDNNAREKQKIRHAVCAV
ncbi:MAG TPA: DUF4385 family protein [Pyrinomonadaceae bacterium]